MNFIIRKNPSISLLLKFVDKQEKKNKDVEMVVEDIDVSNFYDEEMLLERFDIDEAKYEKKLYAC